MNIEKEPYMHTVDRTSKLPLYLQVYQILREEIRHGTWKPGEIIPPEPSLITSFGVSRTIIRQALDRLAGEGMIYRQQGRGTFVSHPPLEKEMSGIVSFTEDMKRRGFFPLTRVLLTQILPASSRMNKELSVPPGEPLVRMKRLRLADGEPMSIEDSYLVEKMCPHILEEDFTRLSLRETLKNRYHVFLTRAHQRIRAVAAGEETASLLSVRTLSPLLKVERVSYSRENIPVEFLTIVYRGDRYTLYHELRG